MVVPALLMTKPRFYNISFIGQANQTKSGSVPDLDLFDVRGHFPPDQVKVIGLLEVKPEIGAGTKPFSQPESCFCNYGTFSGNYLRNPISRNLEQSLDTLPDFLISQNEKRFSMKSYRRVHLSID